MPDYILLRQRSLLTRYLLSPVVFYRHYHAFRVFGARRLNALHAAFLFTEVLLSWPCDR